MKRDMCWEWNWPHRLLGHSRGISFDVHLLQHVHAPGFAAGVEDLTCRLEV